MAKDVTITARIETALNTRLARLAKAQGRSKSWLVERALESFVTGELAFLEAVEEGRKAARVGRVSPQEDVEARFFSRFGKAE